MTQWRSKAEAKSAKIELKNVMVIYGINIICFLPRVKMVVFAKNIVGY